MRKTHVVFALAFVVISVVPLLAQAGRRDPLNEKEIDELRETAQEPEKRLKLMVQYARARVATIEELRGDPRFAADRGPRIHDLLEDFTRLVDEIGDNVDDYARRKADLRKPLKLVIEADTEWQLKLRTLKEQGAGAGGKGDSETNDYNFVLQNAIEAVNSSLDDARKLLAEQEVTIKEEKKKKKK